MKAIEAFRYNVKRSRNLVRLYENLIAEEHNHGDVSDLLRSALALCVGALDAYIHGKISENIVPYIKSCVKKHSSIRLAEKAKSEKPKKTVLESLEDRLKSHLSPSVLLAAATMQRPFVAIRGSFNDYLYKRTFQNAENIEEALNLISLASPWSALAERLGCVDSELMKELNDLVKRRNQIVHEGDRETSRKKHGKRRVIGVDFVKGGIGTIEKIVFELDGIIDSHLKSFHASTNLKNRATKKIRMAVTRPEDQDK